MATYKYQQNLWEGASYGYVKYNITPDIGKHVAPGETVTITGQAFNKNMAVKAIEIWLTVDDNTYQSYFINKSISKGSTGTFTLTFKMGSFDISSSSSNRYKNMPFEFSFSNKAMHYVDDGHGNQYSEPTDGNFDTWSSENTMPVSSQYIRYLSYREKPTVSNLSFSDTIGAFERFGSYVQNQSSLLASFTESVDTIDSSVAISERVLTFTSGDVSTQVNLTSNSSAVVGTVNLSGEVSYSLYVIDNKGMQSDPITGTVNFLSYEEPQLLTFTPARYSTFIDESGGTGYQVDDEGENVWLSFAGKVCSVNGLNEWSAVVEWGLENETTVHKEVLSGTDGRDIVVKNDYTMITDDVSASSNYSFILTLTDWFGNAARLSGSVYKTGGYFNVEVNGVAVGMRSTGTAEDKKFEVAEDYTANFYGGIGDFGGSIQIGYVYSISVKANSCTEGTVTFDTPFKSTPVVILQPLSYSTSAGYGSITFSISGGNILTTDGFGWRVHNTHTAALTPSLRWVAIGEI